MALRNARRFALLSLIIAVAGSVAAAAGRPAVVGESVKAWPLALSNWGVRGLAFDDVSARAPRLFVLDGTGRVFVYHVASAGDSIANLEPAGTIDLPKADRPAASPRGLAYALERGRDVLYFLDWKYAAADTLSELIRWEIEDGTVARWNLAYSTYRIGNREILDVALSAGKILVSFDASGYGDPNLRAQRGIIRLTPSEPGGRGPLFDRHLPDSGIAGATGLAGMDWEGARYLWGTAGRKAVYCADGATGRGLFHFAPPSEDSSMDTSRGLAYGLGYLWVPEGGEGRAFVHQVNVTHNLDASTEGPHILRHLVMTIDTDPEGHDPSPGRVYHYYSRPYAYEQLHNQGVWPETESATDLSGMPNATVKSFDYDPAGDVSSRQHMRLVEYADAPQVSYKSRYEIDMWTNAYRKYVYPHRVDTKAEPLAGLGYLADDPELYNLTDKKTYDDLFARVRAHIQAKYGEPADMANPYWAARNFLEYVMDNYYYPSRPHGVPAAVDYNRKHYDANPGNLKIELSARPYDKHQIAACSGTSVMFSGAMRYLGIPARWLGTGTEEGPAAWDANGNGLLDPEETAECSNGHRYAQVWLGSRYGWICFDATPVKPDQDDFDVPPPLRSQWTFMNRAAAGHLKDKRIVFNVGSALFRPLYRDYLYDEGLAVDNDCGGDQRYNLQGRFDNPKLWKLAVHTIAVRNLCFVENVTVVGPAARSVVKWSLKGAWDKDPQAALSVHVERDDPAGGGFVEVAVPVRNISPASGEALIDLSGYKGQRLRVVIRKVGDPETGGASPVFNVNLD